MTDAVISDADLDALFRRQGEPGAEIETRALALRKPADTEARDGLWTVRVGGERVAQLNAGAFRSARSLRAHLRELAREHAGYEPDSSGSS